MGQALKTAPAGLLGKESKQRHPKPSSIPFGSIKASSVEGAPRGCTTQESGGEWAFANGSNSCSTTALNQGDVAGNSHLGAKGKLASASSPSSNSDLPPLNHNSKLESPAAYDDEGDACVPRKASLYTMFVLLGCNSLLCWNFVIQTLPFILLQKLNRPNLNNLFLGSYQVANICMQVVLMMLSKSRPMLVVLASVGSGMLGLLLATAVAVAPEQPRHLQQDMDIHLMESEHTLQELPLTYEQKAFFGVMIVTNVLMGCCQGLIQGVGYTLSSQITPGYVAAVSVGQGLAGLMVFCLSTISCFLLFEVDTSVGLIRFCFMSFGLVACLGFAFAAFFFFRIRNPDIATKLDRLGSDGLEPESSVAGKGQPTPLENMETSGHSLVWCVKHSSQQTGGEDQERKGILWIRVLRVSWRELLLAVFHFCYTYHLYPNVGPLRWRYSWTFPNQIVVLYGAWFLFETIGRAAPDFGWVKGLGFLRPSRRAYAPISLSTLIYLVPFLVGYLARSNGFYTDPIWYMFVLSSFAFCHGWIGTLAFYYACNATNDSRERRVAGPLTVLSVGVGCVVGFFSSLAY